MEFIDFESDTHSYKKILELFTKYDNYSKISQF